MYAAVGRRVKGPEAAEDRLRTLKTFELRLWMEPES